MCSCENQTEHPSLLVKEFDKSGMLSFINHTTLYTCKQHFSVSSYREMCYFPSIFIVVKVLVYLHICCQALVHAKRKKQEEEKNPKEAGISSEKRMD